MFSKSIIIFCFCLILHLSSSIPAPGEDDELIQIPKKLFTELMGKRDELIRLKYIQGKNLTDEPIPKKIGNVLDRIKKWKSDVVHKAQIEEDVLDLKEAMQEWKNSAKNLLKAGKEGGKHVINIGGKVLKIALKIQRASFNKTTATK